MALFRFLAIAWLYSWPQLTLADEIFHTVLSSDELRRVGFAVVHVRFLKECSSSLRNCVRIQFSTRAAAP
jgi:hypothetical protein